MADQQAVKIIEQYNVWITSMKWLRNTVRKFKNYMLDTIIPSIQSSPDIKIKTTLTERFAYFFNALLGEYEFLVEGTKKFKMHENDHRLSHTALTTGVGKLMGKAAAKGLNSELETIDLQLYASEREKIVACLQNIFDEFCSNLTDISIDQNPRLFDVCSKMYLNSYKIKGQEIPKKLDNSRVSFASIEMCRQHFDRLQTAGIF
jgi:hypothetical protein